MRLKAYFPRPQPIFALLLVFGVAEGCASISSKDDAGTPTVSLGDSGNLVVAPDAGTKDAGTGAHDPPLNPLCGKVGTCGGTHPSPDNAEACVGGPAGSGGAQGKEAGSLPDASLVPDASADGAVSDGAVADGHHEIGRDAGAESGSDHPVPPDGAPPYTETPEVDAGARFSCQVRAGDNGAPIHECLPAGAGDVGSPCGGAVECRAGLACVGKGSGSAGTGSVGSGQCQPYCCDYVDEADAGARCKPRPRPDGGTTPTFCSPQPLIEDRQKTKLMVPVCVPAEGCFLGESYGCPPDETCAVVRSDGTTACVTPGSGKVGDTCSDHRCAAGYFCSAANLCIKICKPGFTDALCEPGKCQATVGLPDGFGLCVSARPAIK